MALCTVFFRRRVDRLPARLASRRDEPFLRYLTYVITPLFPFVGLMLTVVRTVVTTSEVRVDHGLWGPRIPIRAIRCARCGLARLCAGARVILPAGTQAVLLEWEAQGKRSGTHRLQ